MQINLFIGISVIYLLLKGYHISNNIVHLNVYKIYNSHYSWLINV